MDAPEIIISPYVTSRGGVVILNGPFPIDQAKQVAALCKAAPDLLEACELVEAGLSNDKPENPEKQRTAMLRILRAAIAKARP